MNPSDATQVLQPLAWSDPRAHLLDDSWLLTIFAVLLATVVPWLVSGLDIQFISACLGLLALGGIHVAFTAYGRPARRSERRALLIALHIAGILILGFIWLSVGGLQNPAFLIVFALPVVGAIFLSRWQPYLMAVLAVFVAGAIALAQAPELRWYAPGLNMIGGWLGAVLGQEGAGASAPFAGFYAPAAYYMVLLQVFAILIVASAVAAEYLGTIYERLHSHVESARAEAQRGQEFWATMIEDLPTPALLVDADTVQIVSASEQAEALCGTDESTGRNLLDVIRFSYPEVVQELITGTGGSSPLSMIKVNEQLRATEVHVQHLTPKGRRFALVVLQDKTEEFTARAALDVTGQAVIVIDARDRVLIFNKPAQALFSQLDSYASAIELLDLEGLPSRWWEPGLTGRRKMHVEIGPRVYQVTCSASPLPGEDERFYVVAFLPVARASGEVSSAGAQALDAPKLNSTLVSPR